MERTEPKSSQRCIMRIKIQWARDATETIPTEHMENILHLQDREGGEDLHPWNFSKHISVRH